MLIGTKSIRRKKQRERGREGGGTRLRCLRLVHPMGIFLIYMVKWTNPIATRDCVKRFVTCFHGKVCFPRHVWSNFAFSNILFPNSTKYFKQIVIVSIEVNYGTFLRT